MADTSSGIRQVVQRAASMFFGVSAVRPTVPLPALRPAVIEPTTPPSVLVERPGSRCQTGQSGVPWLRLAGALLFFAVALATAFGNVRTASALQEWYRMYPALDQSGIWEYGWHFDELGYTGFGARDFNATADEGDPVYLRVQLSKYIQSGLSFKFTRLNDCHLKAQAGYFDYNHWYWVDFSNEVFHFYHLEDRVTTGSMTTQVYQLNASIYHQIGTVVDSSCLAQQAHAHQSADVSPSTPIYRQGNEDTCWTNDDGTLAWQCYSTYKEDYQPYTCPPGAYSGYYVGVSGVINRYICETWSIIYWSPATMVFKVLKP